MSFLAGGAEMVETGRRLGHDLFRYRKRVVPERVASSIREGFEQAAARDVRAEVPDRFVRKWLQLRVNAFDRGRAFDERVTPQLIAAIDVDICPVLRMQLTHSENADSDWSADRLNNDGAYAPNNLAVISTRANRAKASLSYESVYGRSQRPDSSDGLRPVEWLRMAALMLGPCFAHRPAMAPCIPLVAPVPAYSVRLAMQQVQHVFTLMARTPSGKNALIKHFKLAASSDRSALRLFLLAEAVHAGLKQVGMAHDVWLQPGVMNALLRWRESLDLDAWALAGAVSGRLANSSLIPPGRLSAWRLGSKGYMA